MKSTIDAILEQLKQTEQLLDLTCGSLYPGLWDRVSDAYGDNAALMEEWACFMRLVRILEQTIDIRRPFWTGSYMEDLQNTHKALLQHGHVSNDADVLPSGTPVVQGLQAYLFAIANVYGFCGYQREGYRLHSQSPVTAANTDYRKTLDRRDAPNRSFAQSAAARHVARVFRKLRLAQSPPPDETKIKGSPLDGPPYKPYEATVNDLDLILLGGEQAMELWHHFIALVTALEDEIHLPASNKAYVANYKRFHRKITSERPDHSTQTARLPAGGPGITSEDLYGLARQYNLLGPSAIDAELLKISIYARLSKYLKATNRFKGLPEDYIFPVTIGLDLGFMAGWMT